MYWAAHFISTIFSSFSSYFCTFVVLIEFSFSFVSTVDTFWPFEMTQDCSTIQLIDWDGVFDISAVDKFIKKVNLIQCGLSYAVVSIMGPQSSGKSTLLNHLFQTNFKEMDAFTGRCQTTKGIWLAKCADIEPSTLVMDMEGTDGRERGQDNTAFEKQSALFALAISDVVLINIWCHDIGREHAANKPLLKTVFQVMMRLFSPRKITMMFVIRDKTKTPFETLKSILSDDIQKIWDGVPKPDAHIDTPLSDFFTVEIMALSSYEEKEEDFKQQVASLKQRFSNSIAPGGLAGDRRGVIPASAFSFSSQQIWKTIKENKDLDLPSHKVMVAHVRCEEIADEMLAAFNADVSWLKLKEASHNSLEEKSGKKISHIIGIYISGYDKEVLYFDESVKGAKRVQLETKLLQLVEPVYQSILEKLCSNILDDFKKALEQELDSGKEFALISNSCTELFMSRFDDGCADAEIEQAKWDSSKFNKKLKGDIEAHVTSVRSAKLAELSVLYEAKIKIALEETVGVLLDSADIDTWPSIRKLLQREMNIVVSELSSSLSTFDIDQEIGDKKISDLEAYARSVVESKAKQEASRALIRMKDRFSLLFNRDADSMPRIWTRKEDIRAITKNARSSSLKLLSVLAAIRLDDHTDNIEKALSTALLEQSKKNRVSKNLTIDPLATRSWEEVDPSKTLITPFQCKSLWRQFMAETEYNVTQAIAAQESNIRSNSRIPPAWAILAILVLGFNEFMALLRNPLYLGAAFVILLLAKAIWIQLDITSDFQNGTLSGLLSLSTKFIPTTMNLLRRLVDEGNRPASPDSENSKHTTDSAKTPSSSSL
ncbi:putative Protein SEY1 [Zostera marina]|uniref:Protein ROOT HAIR DEFECTIVE 3 homolog n=1 Tax=Zostera marina TaxID=29655 RepID=A0A0K9NSZ1_ZOSMR|nr:putative Protein SEY1 [Zostera marina]